jgi:hypothetical protein
MKIQRRVLVTPNYMMGIHWDDFGAGGAVGAWRDFTVIFVESLPDASDSSVSTLNLSNLNGVALLVGSLEPWELGETSR